MNNKVHQHGLSCLRRGMRMRTKYVLTMLVVASVLSGCQSKKASDDSMNVETQPIRIEQSSSEETKGTKEEISSSEEAQTKSKSDGTSKKEETTGNQETKVDINKKDVTNTEKQNSGVSKIIEGKQLVDGQEVPVKATLKLESIQRGDEAYKLLSKGNAELTKPADDMEYIVVTFNVSYTEGEAEELYLAENRGSMESGKLYFALSNGDSNGEDVSSYLENNIYNLSMVKGESKQGAVAFLHKKNSKEPLYFIGFNTKAEFDINN